MRLVISLIILFLEEFKMIYYSIIFEYITIFSLKGFNAAIYKA